MNQIKEDALCALVSTCYGSFNPLDRGNLNQIVEHGGILEIGIKFQSPRSGKFESNIEMDIRKLLIPGGFNPLDRGNLNQMVLSQILWLMESSFQSPRSGKFESNEAGIKADEYKIVSIP